MKEFTISQMAIEHGNIASLFGNVKIKKKRRITSLIVN